MAEAIGALSWTKEELAEAFRRYLREYGRHATIYSQVIDATGSSDETIDRFTHFIVEELFAAMDFTIRTDAGEDVTYLRRAGEDR